MSKKPAGKKKADMAVPSKDIAPTPQLTREQLEALRAKLMKKFH